jgi:ADP-heptose:LPS heptosyltransferase
LLQPIELFKYIKQTRKKNYDIAINISGGSTSAQIVTSLVKAKYKVSFADDKLWANFTHIQERGDKTYKHMGLESLEFLRFFNLDMPTKQPTLDIKLTNNEIKQAKNDLDKLTKNIKDKKTISIFRNARFDKKIEDSWWSELIDEVTKIDNNIQFIDILSPDIPTKLNDKVLEYSNKDLRVLGAFFKEVDMFISADTGPMHLAVASNAKVLALFNKTSIDTYGALGDGNKTIQINDLTPKDVAKIAYEQLKK